MNRTKLLQVAGALLSTLTSFAYIKKFFYTPEKNKSHYLQDKDGRITIYHGVNVSNYSKTSLDYLPWQTKEDFARLKNWGFNLVRYLVFWQAIEPVKGVYDINTPYIQETLKRLQWLRELGIDVIIDVHQDLYTTRFTGNGFPEWTVNDDGLPFKQQTPWNMNYFEPAVIASYNNFWKSEDLQNRYINILKFILANFDWMDNVIGIDVMNEPFLGTIPYFEKKILTNFYNKIQDMMIVNDFKSEMFFEPMMYTSAGIPSDLRFVPERDCAYYPHYYDAFCHEGKAYKSLNKFIMRKALDIKMREAQEFHCPLLIGEFGISPSVEGHVQYLKDFVGIANENLIGWTYYTYDKKSWDDFGIINEDGSPTDLLEAIRCVYPQKIAGKNPSVYTGDNVFILDYETDASVKGQTEIFIPELRGLAITVNGVTVNRFMKESTSSQVYKHTNDGNEKQHIHISWVG